MLSLSKTSFFSKAIDLSKYVQLNKIFKTEVETVIGLTVNRTGKKGNDVLSTPGMLDEMDNFVINVSNSFLPRGNASKVRSIKLTHKKPLMHGQKFTLETSAIKTTDRFIDFSIKAINPLKNEVIGDALIQVEVC
ncbi:hypothetical protein TVAG_334060 [Trichomonas vaginalis G3]|uniref:Fluoroacetyl-CoA-specific thioesterase-like domain-containing protein n=1 Tax=Trichomonas vaginalis (strain ATCC PRA-98 / G3) TaxID=412133 RepID=A2EIB2_TRIV3|nr:Hotdog thioesterase domain-containing protein [Trichomonas vaginalis G3]EAY07594.1 hypothetical protein TVAG_334060 [Trichomonas vaginalis G3]KAI5541962.1 Hotdog thioesterase domain-containing protein [Trichomonas vaginalis G3]|eukprot:XP_001319817.1 hypothetical protein [Trichomonas vaginalis G3]